MFPFILLLYLLLHLSGVPLTKASNVQWEMIVTTPHDAPPNPSSCLASDRKDTACSLRSAWTACAAKVQNASLLATTTPHSHLACVIRFSSSLNYKQIDISSILNKPSSTQSVLSLVPSATAKNIQKPSAAPISISISLVGSGQIIQGDRHLPSRFLNFNANHSNPRYMYAISISNVTIQGFGGFAGGGKQSDNGGCISVQGHPATSNVQVSLRHVTLTQCTGGNDAKSDDDTVEQVNILMCGGGLYVRHSSRCDISRSNFHTNKADRGGAMYIIDSKNIYFTDTFITNNEAIHRGGGFYFVNSQSVSLTRVFIDNNHAQKEGGGLYVQKSGNISFIESTFSKNLATVNGGGGFFSMCDANVTMTHVLFQNNTAYQDGGAIWATANKRIKFSNVTFLQNRAGAVGGGVYSSWNTIMWMRTFFLGNTGWGGGAAYFDNCKVFITRSKIADNSAFGVSNGGSTGGGGVIY